MKFRGLLIAVLVLLVLAGLLYRSNHRKLSEQNAAPSSNALPAILKLDQQAATQMTIERRGAAPVMLVKEDGGNWRISQPKPLRADQESVSAVLSTLSNLNADRVVQEKASDLAQYGLAQPAVVVGVTEKDQKTQKLFLGDDTPAGSDAYAMLLGDPRVFTIAGYNKASLDKGLNDLRDKRLLPASPDKVSRVELVKKGQSIEFERTKDGWQIVKPAPLRADSFAIDELVRSLCASQMDLGENETGSDVQEFAGMVPFETVKVTGDIGDQTLEVRKDKGNYYAKSSAVGGIYKVEPSLGEALDKGLNDFRNKNLFDFGYQEPNGIELHDDAKTWTFTHNGTDWWSNGRKMDGPAVESLVDKLRDLAATGFPESGFARPAMEVTVTSAEGKRIERVQIAKSGNRCIAKREGEPSLYQLDARAITELAQAADAIKPAANTAKK